jgi:urea transport system substrate-binding protein
MLRHPLFSKLRNVAIAALAVATLAPAARAQDTIKVGVLHSLTGTMAISEVSLRDVVMMAVDEINAEGGVLGKQIEPVIVDPASDWDLFADKAKQLLLQDEVAVTFGCWTSVSRKSVLPVYEQYNGLLFYPVQYEGEECSKNVFYTGAAVNQQAAPAVQYLLDEGFTRFYLLGTDYVYPQTTNTILKAMLEAKGISSDDYRVKYTPFHHQDYQSIVAEIKEFAAPGDTCVISTINGDSNVPFYKEFANQGLTADDVPIMAFSVAEDELRGMDTSALVGHLAAWNYYQSIDTADNVSFVERFKVYCEVNGLPGGSDRVTDDPIEAAYYGVYVWAAAVEKAGTTDVDAVRTATYGLEFDAPGGAKKMDEVNHHTWKPVIIGEILADGQFGIVWESDGLVRPMPWSEFTYPDRDCDHVNHDGTFDKMAAH